jgi:two-component system, OmpR family, response regulator CpxR
MTGHPTPHQHQILVVDDDEDIRTSLVEFLEDHGFSAIGAFDGRDALHKLGTLDPKPCLIVLDLMMPTMDGRAFRQRQLAEEPLSRIPVVVISAYRDVVASSKDLSVTYSLPKPLDMPALLRIASHHCASADLETPAN